MNLYNKMLEDIIFKLNIASTAQILSNSFIKHNQKRHLFIQKIQNRSHQIETEVYKFHLTQINLDYLTEMI